MAENESTPIDTPEAGEGAGQAAAAEPSTLTDIQLAAFSAAVAADPKDAYSRWGLALFHSQSDEQAQAQMTALKIELKDALGHYNHGVVLAQKEKYADAARSFAKAAELDPTLIEAVYNLALAEEKAGNTSEARKRWNRYLELCQDPEESAEVKNHITELANR